MLASSRFDLPNVNQYLAYSELKDLMLSLCRELKTGHLTLVTNNREIISVIFDGGDIAGLLFRDKFGRQALDSLKSIQSAKCRFIESKAQGRTKHVHHTDLPATVDTLRILGIPVDQALINKLGKKILVVEDSATIRKAISIPLAAANFRVLEASSGEEALQLLEHKKVDMVLLDIIMPGLDGYEVLEIIRTKYSNENLPVLMLTSRDSLFDQMKGKLSSCDEYITKPIKAEALLKVVDKYI